MRDRLNAFLDLPEVPVESAAAGPLAGLTLGVKDIFDVKGYVSGWGNPDKFEEGKVAEATAPAVQKLLDAGARFIGKTQTEELAFSMIGQNVHFRASGQSEGAGPGHGRIVVGIGRGGRRRAGRHRDRVGHRRLGARAGEFLRADRAAHDAWGDLARRHDAAGAVFDTFGWFAGMRRFMRRWAR